MRRRHAIFHLCASMAACAWLGLAASAIAARYDGQLAITALDEETQEPLAVRMELRDARGRPVRARPEGAVVAGESIYFDGAVTLQLRRGQYQFLIEAGPEYRTRPGHFTIDRSAEDVEEVTLKRSVDMRAEGWWAGDLDVDASAADLPLMMRARGVDFVPATALVNDRGQCRRAKTPPRERETVEASLIHGPWTALDYRRGGGILLVGGDRAVDVCQWKVNEPSLSSLAAGRQAGACVVALTPTAWDLPLWVASGKLDAVQVLHRYTMEGASPADPRERPCDPARFAGKLGAGRCGEAIYHHLLNCGLRLPPAAGSGAGALSGRKAADTPPGFNRTYVFCDEAFSLETWLAGLRAGQVTITNGPLLRTRAEGRPPGYVFQLERGEKHELQIALDLAFYAEHQVEYLEIVKDGRAVHQIRLAELAERAGRLPPVEFDGSGWFLVRAVTNNPGLYQYASTGPYYVEVDYRPRISRASVKYFLDWLDAAAAKFADNAAVLADIEAARTFWTDLAERVSAD
jgi:hypothetical protein